jgi:hypothetical protein
MSNYPLCTQAGLKVRPPNGIIFAEEVEAMLANSFKVFGDGAKTEWRPWISDETKHLAISSNFKNSKFVGYIINIKPIEKPDTAESLLRELTDMIKPDEALGGLIARARKLLDKGEK